MRILFAVLGTVALLGGSALAMVFSVMALTPTSSCEGTDTSTGVCAYGTLPLKLALFGPMIVIPPLLLATWLYAAGRPRVVWPYVGIAVVGLLIWVAFSIATGEPG